MTELAKFGESVGWQAFFKAEFTCSGKGVTATESERMFLDTATALLETGKQFIVQETIQGDTAMRAAVAFEGKILCGTSFKKITSAAGGIGYSTVVMPVQHDGMKATTELIADMLKINGPFSCDFILDNASGEAYLLEINPRPTTLFHLGYFFGVSFARAFEAIIDGTGGIQNDVAPENTEVALFPKELFRDLNSPRLATAFHDVPWAYPRLVAHYLSMIAEKDPCRTASRQFCSRDNDNDNT
jgi:predicted ATP-grasp superfamily ATP-dependent carboligase